MFYEQAHPEEGPRQRKWKEMAGRMNIEVVEDEQLRQARIDRELAKVQAEFMND